MDIDPKEGKDYRLFERRGEFGIFYECLHCTAISGGYRDKELARHLAEIHLQLSSNEHGR